jgi:dTDP-4-amino-4,6-dideoxygalactose transaminase
MRYGFTGSQSKTIPQGRSAPAAGMIPFNRYEPAPHAAENLAQVLAGGHLSGDGPFTRMATARIRDALDGADVLLTTSGTHSLELAALVARIGPDDEVVMPSFTFSSTAAAFALRGARVRFADIDPGTLSMERPQLEAACTPATTAVCMMPYGGVMRDPGEIAGFCNERGLQVFEDAAHAIFARSSGRPFGTFGRLATLSFHNTKNVSGGEAGALVVNGAPEAFALAQVLREKGTNRAAFLRGEVDKYTWREVGSSYLPSELVAAVLAAELAGAAEKQANRHAAWQAYRERLDPLRARYGLRMQEIPPTVEHPAHVFAIILPASIDRTALLGLLRANGVQAAWHYEPLHRAVAHDRLRAAAGRDREELPVTDAVAPSLLRLPLYGTITLEEVDAVIRAVEESLARLASAR